jgi:FixJ family two-component response regulator
MRREWRAREIAMPEARTILIAVADGILADSLRFSLELEGFDAEFCDGCSLLSAMTGGHTPGCLLLDQDVFTRMLDGECEPVLAEIGMPVVLMVGHTTQRVLARAKAAGVTTVVEKPLLGAVLFEAIRHALYGKGPTGPALGSS